MRKSMANELNEKETNGAMICHSVTIADVNESIHQVVIANNSYLNVEMRENYIHHEQFDIVLGLVF